MGRVKSELLSEAACIYCEKLFDKRFEEAGYSACPTCQQAVSKAVVILVSGEVRDEPRPSAR